MLFRSLFPELLNSPSVTQLNGETKIAVEVEHVRPGSAVRQMPIWGVLSLSRGADGSSRMTDASPERIHRSLVSFKDDSMLDIGAMDRAAEKLALGRIAHLVAGCDPMECAAVIANWLESGT